jgi:hypothetical protein
MRAQSPLIDPGLATTAECVRFGGSVLYPTGLRLIFEERRLGQVTKVIFRA